MGKGQAGFTLIELMIVIAILGILAGMAAPTFQDRLIRAQVEDGLSLAQVATREVDDYYRKRGRLPEDNRALGLPAASRIMGNYTESVAVASGTVRIVFGKRANKHLQGKVLVLRPALVRNEPRVPIAWVCGHAPAAEGMTVYGDNATTVIKQHLPVSCRF